MLIDIQVSPRPSEQPRARSVRGAAATIVVVLVHIGFAWMLLVVHQSAWRPHKPRPFQVVMVPPAPARTEAPARDRMPERPKPKAHNTREREPSTAITYPPVPESVFDDALANGALRNTPDCSAENLARLAPGQRQQCGRMFGAIPSGNETDFIDPTLRARFRDEFRQKGRLNAGPFRTCPAGSRRSLMGLSCWKGLDN